MPRKKSAPVRREVDRFHPDSLETRSVVREDAEQDSECEEGIHDLEETVDSPRPESIVAKNLIDDGSECQAEPNVAHSCRVRIDSNASDDNRGWMEISKKHLPLAECCNTACRTQAMCLQLHITTSHKLAVVCGACKACLLVSDDATVSVSLCRSLTAAVQSGSIRIQLSTGQTDGSLTLTIWLGSAAKVLSPVVLNWALLGSSVGNADYTEFYCTDPTTTYQNIEQQFSATQFLDQVSGSSESSHASNVNAVAVTELQQRLQGLGVRTKLRGYQLQGVHWMHDNLNRASAPPYCMSQTGVDSTEETEDWQYHAVGWVRLPAPTASWSNSASSISNSSASVGSHNTSLWYNIHTEEVSHSTYPPNHMQLPTSLILADEMGVGKSLQIISLVLLLQATSTSTVPISAQALKSEPCTSVAVADAAMQDVSAAMSVCATALEGTAGGSCTTSVGPVAPHDDVIVMADPVDTASEAMEESSRACLCGEAGDLANKVHRLLGWIQCASCATWLHAPCAGFSDSTTMQQCGEYTCLACSCLQYFAQPIPSRATLIVMPNTLINQWKSELQKHVEKVTFNIPDAEGGFKVFIYPEEVGKKKSENYARLDPCTLARYDIVLLSFKALQKGYHECNVDYGSERILRSGYAIYPPPFLCVHYALMVVDETQNIESTASQVLAMACRIPSTHRISVSGTPFGTGRLADLYTLCQFLRIEPYASNRSAWLRVIERPTVCITAEARLQWLRAVFQRILLRRTKKMIHAELGLPEHSVITKPLQFSTFERALYEEKLGQYCNALLASAFASHTNVSSRNHRTIGSSASMLHGTNSATDGASSSSSTTLHINMFDAKSKLELLRKGCCHPQVLDKRLASKQRSNAAASAVVIAGPRPLDEIMVAKVEQTRLSCEEFQRVLLFNLFAMAGATALQAQCSTLHLTGFDNAVPPAPAAWYLSQAHRIYHIALNLIDRHRQSTVLIALIKLSGDEGLVYNDSKLSAVPGGMLVPHSQEGLQLRWQLGPLQSACSVPVPSAVKSVSWHALVHPAAVFTTLDATAVPLVTQVPLTDCIPAVEGGACARLMFANSRRVTGCSAKLSVTNLIRRFCSAFTETVDTAGMVRHQVVVFPAQIVLQAGVGAADTLVNAHTVQVAFPTAADTSDTDIATDPRIVTATAPRSKKWQLCVKSVHSVCLVLRAEPHSSKGLTFSHAWMTLPAMSSLQEQTMRDLTEAGAQKKCVWEVTTALNVCLRESAFDTDALQELHVCHNMRSLLTLLSDHEELSQYHLHTRQLPHIVATSSTTAVASDFMQLKPGAAVYPGLDARQGADRSGEEAAKFVDHEAAMSVIAQRGAAIEKEFLEAANSRRLVADYNLSELRTQVSDFDRDIGTEIDKLHHRGASSSAHCATVMVVDSVVDAMSCDPGASSASASGRASGGKNAAAAGVGTKDRAWWNELLTSLQDDVHFQASLQSCINQGESAYRKLANFSTAYGLQYLLGREFDDMEQARKASLKVLASLSKTPTAAEILESTDCRQCRQYFGKTGPVCGHCKKQAYIQEYSTHILCFRRQNKRMVATTSAAAGASPKKKAKSSSKSGASSSAAHASGVHILGDRDGDYEDEQERADFEVRSFDEGAVDGLLLMVLKQLRPQAAHFYTGDENATDGTSPSSGRAHKHTYKELCALEIKRQECLKSELSAMMAAWDRYSDLLKAHDELAQSKTRMSLSLPADIAPSAHNDTSSAGAGAGTSSAFGVSAGQSSSKKSKSKSNADKDGGEESSLQLRPYELPAALNKSYAAVLQADSDLKRSLGSLQFYKEQVREIFAEMHDEDADTTPTGEDTSHNDGVVDASDTVGVYQNSVAEIGAVSSVFSTPSKARIQTCLFCREELQLGSTLHSPAKHRPPLPTTSVDGTAVKEPAVTVSEEVVVLPCAHRYHKDCVTRWVQKHKACPLCKAKATVADFIAVAQYAVGPTGALLSHTPSTPAKALQVSSILDAVQSQTPMKSPRLGNVNALGHIAEANKSTTNSVMEADTTPADGAVVINSSTSSSPTSSAQQVSVRPPPHPQRSRLKGKWGTKVDTLVMDLLELTQDPERQDEKAIVFSQWIEMVDIVCEALRCNGISHVKCANRSKDFIATGGVEMFRNNNTIRVIVMPLALGAEGLDLIVASHVFLLEPLLNIHQELQAVNRISRLGQQKRTYVHKYVISNTIEERIVLVQNHTGEDVRGVYSPNKGHRQRGDDDLLSESDLRFILGIQAHTVGGGQESGDGEQDNAGSAVISLLDAHDQPAASSRAGAVQGMSHPVPVDITSDADDTDGTSTVNGVMELTSNLLEHFE